MSKGRSTSRWAETSIVVGALTCIAAAARLAWVKHPGGYVTTVVVTLIALLVLGTLSGLLFDLASKLGPLRPVAGVLFGMALLAFGVHALLEPTAYVTAADPPADDPADEPALDEPPSGNSTRSSTQDAWTRNRAAYPDGARGEGGLAPSGEAGHV